ncbi:MAG: zf-HC2 domain-containing protein [Syntrophomonadaceae bacterium]|nr:zf-HC2 domain-containing protein [Syntrophomonadaceae bacterium]
MQLLLSAYRDKMTSREETQVVESHLESCVDCQDMLSQLNQICLVLRTLDNLKAPRCLWQDIKRRLD